MITVAPIIVTICSVTMMNSLAELTRFPDLLNLAADGLILLFASLISPGFSFAASSFAHSS